MSIVVAGISPHPPLIIPEVGGREIAEVRRTVESLKKLSAEIAAARPETVIIITPHGPMFRDAVAIQAEEELQGDFSAFRASDVRLTAKNDLELLQAVAEESKKERFELVLLKKRKTSFFSDETALDHGTTVPLYYLQEAGSAGKIMVLTFAMLPYRALFRFGQVLQRAVDKTGRRVAVLASADLSHRLLPGAPAGYDPRGKEFDEKLARHLRDYDVEEILSMDRELISRAGECGLRSIVILLGSLSGLKATPEVFSYEGPFGVGYLVAAFKVGESEVGEQLTGEGSIFVEIARRSLESRVRGESFSLPDDLPPELLQPGAAFVSLKKKGQLRGCIGTIMPTKRTLAEEIAANAVSAGLYDPRFPPVSRRELKDLLYSVDVLTEPEKVDDISALDPQRYGVIVRRGNRSGLLLPALEGITSVEEQLEIARQKAGILPGEDVEIYRFTVKRYY
ncbi:MAG TPA: AMMECR1 domain-containing protein [Firmicutes bacterium]|nr:AMMECR1 domain-containing protein [Bacillota bacterium]